MTFSDEYIRNDKKFHTCNLPEIIETHREDRLTEAPLDSMFRCGFCDRTWRVRTFGFSYRSWERISKRKYVRARKRELRRET